MTVTAIVINESEHDTQIPANDAFQTWVTTALQHANTEITNSINEVTVCLVDRDKSAELNQAFRQKEGPTNVLSFNYDPIPGIEPTSLGDLVICAPLMRDEAKELSLSEQDHWAHLTVHGILHLLGYDHENEADATEMETLEIQILQQLNINNPYSDTHS